MTNVYDAVVIGGGFYGATIAVHLGEKMPEVLLIEKNNQLLSRASYVNQARIHGGYHYPRSINTAYRSRVNFGKFYREFRDAVVDNFLSVYCIARTNSKISPKHFLTFCNQIGAPIKNARPGVEKLFPSRLISAVYETEESSFNSAILREILETRLKASQVELRLNTTVTCVKTTTERLDGRQIIDVTQSGDVIAKAKHVFNCSYSGLNHVIEPGRHGNVALKHEITEVALVKVPPVFEEMGITVMDGPFFSLFPFPARNLHSFTHVRYTPHSSWIEGASGELHPYDIFKRNNKISKYRYMLKDASRFVPLLAQLDYIESLYEIKTVLTSNEVDDGRPILFEAAEDNPNVVSILGSKIDNVFDVLKVVDKLISN